MSSCQSKLMYTFHLFKHCMFTFPTYCFYVKLTVITRKIKSCTLDSIKFCLKFIVQHRSKTALIKTYKVTRKNCLVKIKSFSINKLFNFNSKHITQTRWTSKLTPKQVLAINCDASKK